MASYQTLRKVEFLKNVKRPTTITEIQTFLGLASYYRRIIRNFANIAHPLIELTRKKKVKLDKKRQEKGSDYEGRLKQYRRIYLGLQGTGRF